MSALDIAQISACLKQINLTERRRRERLWSVDMRTINQVKRITSSYRITNNNYQSEIRTSVWILLITISNVGTLFYDQCLFHQFKLSIPAW